MSRINRTRRKTMLSPLAFALAFGAYAQQAPAFAPATQGTRTVSAPRADLDWMVGWLEKHGTF